ncbi:MAG: hypothetical protein ACR2NV_04720 [Thermoleophilaceae bacterium]
MTWRRRALGDVLAAVAVAVAVALALGPAFLNYDTFYSLVWGADLLDGRRPAYGVPFAPTPHPLAIAVGALLSPLGDAAEEVLIAVGLLGLGAIAVGLYRLGAELFAPAVGLLAALIVVTRVPFLSFGVRGYVDLPAVALVVWAAVLEARRPRRGAAVLVLLALAGLLRPEFWLFSAAYWLWVARYERERAALVRLATIAAIAPVLWLLSDFLVTGDPLWSLTGTSENAELLERPTGLADLVRVTPFRLGEILRLPELIAAVLGLGVALVGFRRRVLLPAAVAVLNGVAFAAFAVAGLPLLGRYLFTASTMLALLAAVAVFGWRGLPREHPRRRAWMAAGLVLLAVILAFTPIQAGRVAALRDDIAARDRAQADLRALTRSPGAARALESCGPLFMPTHRPIPQVSYWTDVPAAAIRSAGVVPPGNNGVFIAAASPEVARLALLDPRDPTPARLRPPRRWQTVAANASWRMVASCRPGG